MKTIKEKARIAWEKDLEIIVYAFGSSEYKGFLESPPSNSVKIHGGRIGFCDINDIRFVGEAGEEDAVLGAMPYDFIRERLDDMSESFGSLKYVELEYAKNAVSEAEEKSRNAEPEPPADDIAFERWEWFDGKPGKMAGLYCKKSDGNDKLLATHEYATPEQKAVMAAAPEVADLARKVCDFGIPAEYAALAAAVCELSEVLRKHDLLLSQNRKT